MCGHFLLKPHVVGVVGDDVGCWISLSMVVCGEKLMTLRMKGKWADR